MSVNSHRPVRKRPAPRSKPAVAAMPIVQAALEVPAEQSTAPVTHELVSPPVPEDQPAAQPLTLDEWLQGHYARVTGLIDKAGRVAQRMLDKMEQRQSRGEEVYPREFIFVCRGLQVLARCACDLSRIVHAASKADAASAKAGQAEARAQQRAADTAFSADLAAFTNLARALPREWPVKG